MFWSKFWVDIGTLEEFWGPFYFLRPIGAYSEDISAFRESLRLDIEFLEGFSRLLLHFGDTWSVVLACWGQLGVLVTLWLSLLISINLFSSDKYW